MKRFILTIALVLSLFIMALPAHAAGAQTIHHSFKGQLADATFRSVDGGRETFVFVQAVNGRVKETGHPAVDSAVDVAISQSDASGTLLLLAFGSAPLAPNQFQIDKKITRATLNATIEVTDILSGDTFTVDANVSWTGSGEAVTTKNHSHIKEPGFTVNFHATGTTRNAAATGSVVLGGTNLTPEPAFSAEMIAAKGGEVDITHP